MALSMKSASALTTRAATRGRTSVVRKAGEGNWYPGAPKPAYLEGLPGNFGFDPLELGKDAGSLTLFRQAEVYHCRWAMLGVAGALGVEEFGYGDWVQAQEWVVAGGKPTYFGISPPHDLDVKAVIGVLLALFAAERGMYMTGPEERKIYPGGAFDPMGLSKGANAESFKLKELKNGRLAMIAFMGLVGQHAATGKGPIQALVEHVQNPWTANFATNGVSVPFF